MTLPLERARSRRPVTWLTLVGVILLPVVIGGILVAALYNPSERLSDMRAAIVNDDEPVTLDGQTVPLGRQLTAGLVDGSDDLPSNLDWTISNTRDARAGLADGTYDAVITIPENFSAAATSTAGSGTAQKARISVDTAPDSLIVDDAITAQVAQAAASVLGEQLSSTYLENVFVGFTTLGTQLGDAAAGAHTLADGAAQASAGAAELPAGASALSSGAVQLGDGAVELSAGLGTIADKTREAASGAGQLADGVDAGAAQLVASGLLPAQLSDLSNQAAAAATGTAAAATGTASALAGLSAGCAASGAAPEYCAQVAAVLGAAETTQTAATGTATATGYLDGGLDQFAAQAPTTIAGQFSEIAANVRTLQGGLGQLAGGVDQSRAGAAALGTGADQLADGADQLADGATQLADGVSQVATGTASLADGLTEASAAVPSYTDDEATNLASVVADPVTADGIGSNIFGASAIPLLAMLALWFGALASFVALQAVPRHALSSRRSSAALAGRSLLPAAAIGALQGLLVAGVVQLAAAYDAPTWFAFAGLAAVAGVAFAAVNQALVGVFGGAGRWISALVGVLAVATGIVSTVPGVLTSVAALMPTTPAYQAMLGALTASGGIGAGVVGMIVWAALAFVVTVVAVARRRTTSPRALLAASPALA